MKLFARALVLVSAPVWACKGKVDPTRAVVFIDTNNSFLEAQAASEAACVRGETFVMLPYGLEFARKGHALKARQNAVEREYERLDRKSSLTPAERARKEVLESQYTQLEKQLDTLTEGKPDFDETVKHGISALAQQNVAIRAVAVSGHDGGGSMHGDLGGIDKNQFAALMHEAYQGKPELENQLSSVLMWGCYTSTPSEVMAWRSEFPHLKILAGFYDSGPSNERPASFELMKDLLIKAGVMGNACDAASLRQKIRGLTHIPLTFAAMSITNKCGQEYYYSRTDDSADFDSVKIKENFSRFEASCDNASSEEILDGLSENTYKFYRGEAAIPADTGHSALRMIYSTARHMQHCIPEESVMSPDRLGLLLFYRGVKENFMKHFGEALALVQQDLDKLKEWAKNPQWAEYLDTNFKTDGKLDLSQTLENRSKMIDFAQVLGGLVDASANDETPEGKGRTERLKKIEKAVDRVLYRLDTSCMDFLEWHEAKPNYTPPLNCNLSE